MTSNTNDAYLKQIANGSTNIFTYDFYVAKQSDLLVFLNGTEESVVDVTGVGESGGGTFTINEAPDNMTVVLAIRDLPIERQTSFTTNGDLTAELLNKEFDYIKNLIEQLEIKNSRAIRFTNNADLTGTTLQLPQPVPGSLLRINEEGTAIEFVSVSTNAQQANDCRDIATNLFDIWRDDYAGHGQNLPTTENDGTLFYYDGTDYTQGLYIYYDSNDNALTGKWALVSGVGVQGPTGAEGIQGAIGVTGEQGIIGPTGDMGVQGLQGPIGSTGPAGIKGETGATGPQGVQGVVGPVGEQGATGNTGGDGPTGDMGVQGELGATGPQGVIGSTGATGATGPQGIQGAEGAEGVEGKSFNIDETGTILERDSHNLALKGFAYYATDYVDLGDPDAGLGAIFIKASSSIGDWGAAIPFGKGPTGDSGPLGSTGPQGSTGSTGPIGPTGQQGLLGPQGVVGNQGVKGDQGNIGVTGSTGAQGATGIVGPQGATGIVGPQGQEGATGDRGPIGVQGDQGERGPTGNQGPQGVLGATGPQGSQGLVGSTGAQGSQGLVGPTGAKGATGNQGAAGPQGAAGTPTYTWQKFADDLVGTNLSDVPLASSYYKYEAYNKTSPTYSNNYNDYPVKFPIKVLSTRELSITGVLSPYNSLVKIATLSIPSGTWNLTASMSADNQIGSASKTAKIRVNGVYVKTKTSTSSFTLQYDTQLTSSATVELWASQSSSGMAETFVSGAITAKEVV